MEIGQFWSLSAKSDDQIKTALSELLATDYRTEARIIAHLAELEERKLHLKAGSESLFHYCIHVLHLSNSEAFHRITAARIGRKFPIVFRLIEQRKLHLTAICLLRDYLTSENHHELLAQVCHKTKLQIEELLARRFPRPDVESRVRKLPARGSTRRGATRGRSAGVGSPGVYAPGVAVSVPPVMPIVDALVYERSFTYL